MYRAKHGYEIYAVEVCSPSQICLCGRINGYIKIMVLQNTQLYTNLLCIWNCLRLSVLSYSFERAARLGLSGISQLPDHCSLEDQDKQQIGFFIIRFTVEYSDRLVATTTLWKVLGSVCLSRRLCKILVKFVTFMLFSRHLGIWFTLPMAAAFAF